MAMVQRFPALTPVAKPTYSVCIANYNGIDLLADCLDSIFAQNGDLAIEVIVHDDASTDGSIAWLRERYPQVELIASDTNVGFCIGNNRMAEQARGEFLLLLNNDAALFPDALATLRKHAQAHPEAGILTLPQFDWQSGDIVDRGCLLDPFYNPVPNLDPERRDVAMVIGACLWIEASLWRELGGFPEWLESIGEDMYLCCHARLRGHSVHAVPASGYRHRQGASFGGGRAEVLRLDTTFRRRRLSERNKTFVMVVFSPSASAWVLLSLHMPALIAEGLVLSLARRDWRIAREIYFNAISSVFGALSSLLSRRREVQATRVVDVPSYFSAFVAWPRKLAMLRRYGLPKIR